MEGNIVPSQCAVTKPYPTGLNYIPIPPDNLNIDLATKLVKVALDNRPPIPPDFNTPLAVAKIACTLYLRACTYLESNKPKHPAELFVSLFRKFIKTSLETVVPKASLPYKEDVSAYLIDIIYGCCLAEKDALDQLRVIEQELDNSRRAAMLMARAQAAPVSPDLIQYAGVHDPVHPAQEAMGDRHAQLQNGARDHRY